MRKIFLLLITFLSISCNSDDSPPNNSLFGTWQLVGIYGGFPSEWESINNGYVITLNEDGRFTSTKFYCETGTFTYTTDSFTLVYDCPDFTAGFEDPPGVFTEKYWLENGKLFLRPEYLGCVEGCTYQFKRIE